MVEFSKKEKFDYFSVTIEGDKDEYIETVKSLLTFMHSVEDEFATRNTRYYICNLIKGLLPDCDQIINMEDVELLKSIKQQKKQPA
jgi:hypothetical protein